MKKYLLILGVVLGIAVFLFAFNNNTSKTDPSCKKRTICHVPPGNEGNPQTITVGVAGAENHLDNHCLDYCGPCRCAND